MSTLALRKNYFMNKYFLPIVTASLLLAGCSAAYKTGQTPDDVYYSSGPRVVQDEIATTDNRKIDNGSYQSYWQNDDAYLRMKVHNGGKWNSIDDQDYWYGYNGGCQCNSSWGYYNSFNSFNRPWGFNTFAYNSYYNPWSSNYWYNPGYYYPVVIVNKYPVYTNKSRPGLTGYSNNYYERGGGNTRNNTQRSVGNTFRTIFSGSGNSSNVNNSYDRPTRTFSPSSSSSSSSSPGSSSGSSRTSSGSSSSGGRGGRGGQ